MNVTSIGSEPSAGTGRGKRMWRLAGLGAGVAVGIAAVIALGQVGLNGQAADLQRFGLSQLLGGSGIGVTIRDVDSADVTREKLPASLGAVVDDVRADSPAAKAGIRAGDVIVSFDGEKIGAPVTSPGWSTRPPRAVRSRPPSSETVSGSTSKSRRS